MSFTLRSIHEELGSIPHEIIAIDNYCDELKWQGREPDRGHKHLRDKKDTPPGPEGTGSGWVDGHIEAQARQLAWLKVVSFPEKLSHWNAKRVGVDAAQGSWLLFLDAHVVPSRGALEGAWEWIQANQPKATVHMPLTYHILEDKWLAYKPDLKPEKGYAGYSFTSFPGKRRGERAVIEVPCMSTCGMFMPRAVYDHLRGWPEELGIYGGGENYMNYLLPLFGYPKLLWCGGAVHHHGDKRGYSWNYDDTLRNRAIAMYCIGGLPWLERYIDNSRGNPGILGRIQEDVEEKLAARRSYIEAQQVTTIEDWVEKWKNWSF